MKRKIKFVIERHGDIEEEPAQVEEAYSKHDLPYEKVANMLMSTKDYIEYVKKHSYHFTEALAEYASKLMKNDDKSIHSWAANTVKKTVDSLGLSIPSKATLGDVTYTANMAYADFYPDLLKDEASCIKYAIKVANDIDGYEGMAFCRWLADIIGKSVNINWEKFI